MPDPASPSRNSFDFPAAPGGGWPAISGKTDEEVGVPVQASRVDRSDLLRLRYPNFQVWYAAGWWVDLPALTATVIPVQVPANVIWALPFPSNGGGLVRALRVWTTSSGTPTGNFRLALYSPISDANPFPGTLLWQSEENSVQAGGPTVYDVDVNMAIRSQSLYTVAFIRNGWTNVTSMGGDTTSDSILGALNPPSGSVVQFITSSMTYGSFPSRFPTSYTPKTEGDARPFIWIQYGE